MNGWTVVQWQAALSIAETATIAVMAFLALWFKATFASRKELAETNRLAGDGLKALEERVAACERRHATAPDPDRVIDMGTSIARLTASVDALRRELEGVDNRLDRIETHLLERARS